MRTDPFLKCWTSFRVGLLRTACSFLCNFSSLKVMERHSAYHVLNDAHSVQWPLRCFTLRIRFKAQTAICDWTRGEIGPEFLLERPGNYKTVFLRGTQSVVVLSQSFNLIFGYFQLITYSKFPSAINRQYRKITLNSISSTRVRKTE